MAFGFTSQIAAPRHGVRGNFLRMHARVSTILVFLDDLPSSEGLLFTASNGSVLPRGGGKHRAVGSNCSGSPWKFHQRLMEYPPLTGGFSTSFLWTSQLKRSDRTANAPRRSPYSRAERLAADRRLGTPLIRRLASDSLGLMRLGVHGVLAVKYSSSDQPVGLEAEGGGLANNQVVQEADADGRGGSSYRLGQLAVGLRYALETQFSTRRPGTCRNSRSSLVTRRTPRLSACAAMRTSIAPIGRPFFSSAALMVP